MGSVITRCPLVLTLPVLMSENEDYDHRRSAGSYVLEVGSVFVRSGNQNSYSDCATGELSTYIHNLQCSGC